VPGINALALRGENPETPIIFVNVGDPVRDGLVHTTSRPGKNTTGFMGIEYGMAAKWLELLRELSPTTNRALVLCNPDASNQAYARVIESAGAASGVSISSALVTNTEQVESALNAQSGQPDLGLVVLPGGPITVHRTWIIEAAARNRWPAVYAFRYYAVEGGLASYGVSIVDQWRRAATYVHRILNGERAGDLPVQAPTKFDLVINLKTAKALGLTIPPTLLARADEVIECRRATCEQRALDLPAEGCSHYAHVS